MKIISKYKDYYDSASAYGIDETQILIRKTKIIDAIDIPNSILSIVNTNTKNFSFDDISFSVSPFVVGFCGKLYPCIKFVLKKQKIEEPDDITFCYSVKDVISFIEKKKININQEKWEEKVFSDRNSIYYFNELSFVKIFEKKFNEKEVMDIFYKLKVPYFVYFQNEGYREEKKIEVFQILKNYNFAKIFDAFSCYQEVQSFYFGVLGVSHNEMIEIEDKYKIESKGFDKKYGFRKRKA